MAWLPLGWDCAWVAEIDQFPQSVLRHHYGCNTIAMSIKGKSRHRKKGGTWNFGDFTTIKPHWLRRLGVEPIDVLIGGTPCQDFSIAGLRAGLDGARGGLSLEFFTLARRLKPTWLVWENVPGVLSMDEGRVFGHFLRLLAKFGYGFAYRVLDAQYAGVPQRRRRVFLVGYLGDWRPAAAVLFDQESLLGHSAPSRQAREGVASPITPGSRDGSGYRNDADTADNLIPGTLDSMSGGADENDAKDGRLIVGSLTAAGGTKRKHGQGWGQREVESGQLITAFGGNNTSGPIDVATACRAKGGSGHGDFESETFVAHALRADGFDASEDGTGRGTPLVTSFTGGASEIYAEEDIAQPITGRNGDPGMIAFDTTQITSKTNRSKPEAGDPSHPLTSTGHAPAIAFSSKDHGGDVGDVSPTLRGMGHAKSHANAGGQVSATTSTGVRRLTPTECERLMAIPDGYTQVPYRGKPASDGPRYKAIGNSMVVEEIAWIGERIQAVQEIIDGLPPRGE